jgi:hypothetical protein
MRATMSLALPALNGLITWIDRDGQVSAAAAEAVAKSATPATAPHNVRNDGMDTSLKV